MKTSITISILAGCLLEMSVLAQGIVQITFDGPPVPNPGSAVVATNYFESGMLFRPLPQSYGFVRVGTNPVSFRPDDGSAYLQATLGPAETLTFNLTNGALFSLLSVDLAEYSTVVPNAVTVQFVGYHPDGSTVTTSFTTDGIIDGSGPLADFQTFYFGGLGFTDLTHVDIPTSGWSLDNLVVGVVPEPTSAALLALGGLALWQVRRKRLG